MNPDFLIYARDRLWCICAKIQNLGALSERIPYQSTAYLSYLSLSFGISERPWWELG